MTAQTEARASLWAPATADQSVSGWTYDFDQIERISRAAYNGTGYDATMEVVQFVMAEADRRYTTALAAKDAEIAALKKEAALREAEKELACQADFIHRLQAALAFWMPGVHESIEIELNGRPGDDAMLLAGFEGEVPAESWGDRTLTRATAAEAEAAALRKALKPFVALADKRDAHYRRRGGNCDKFPDAHPSYDIDAGKRELPMGVWRAARAALASTRETSDAG